MKLDRLSAIYRDLRNKPGLQPVLGMSLLQNVPPFQLGAWDFKQRDLSHQQLLLQAFEFRLRRSREANFIIGMTWVIFFGMVPVPKQLALPAAFVNDGASWSLRYAATPPTYRSNSQDMILFCGFFPLAEIPTTDFVKFPSCRALWILAVMYDQRAPGPHD